MEVKVIKHRLLIDGIWETLITQDNIVKVYVQKNRLYSKDDFLKAKEYLPYSKKQIEQLEEIYNRDWSALTGEELEVR